MDIFAGMETFLYVVSSALFYPVIVALILLIFWIAISSGGILREYVERKQGNLSSLSRYKKVLESEITSSSRRGDKIARAICRGWRGAWLRPLQRRSSALPAA